MRGSRINEFLAWSSVEQLQTDQQPDGQEKGEPVPITDMMPDGFFDKHPIRNPPLIQRQKHKSAVDAQDIYLMRVRM